MQNIYTVMQIINAAKSRRCDVDICSLQTSKYTDDSMSADPPNQQNTKISSGLFRTGFHSSHSTLYFRSVARFLNNFLNIRKANTTLFGGSGFEQMCTAVLRKLYRCFWMPVQSCSQ